MRKVDHVQIGAGLPARERCLTPAGDAGDSRCDGRDAARRNTGTENRPASASPTGTPEGSRQAHARPEQARQMPEPGQPALCRPVSTLRQYRTVVPGPAFPADAVTLTIDDPHPVWTTKILKLLARHHVPASFCR